MNLCGAKLNDEPAYVALKTALVQIVTGAYMNEGSLPANPLRSRRWCRLWQFNAGQASRADQVVIRLASAAPPVMAAWSPNADAIAFTCFGCLNVAVLVAFRRPARQIVSIPALLK